jgi:hypothetical protein
MDATVAGCAAAASGIGYPHFAALILAERMTPEHIARLFTLSASKQAGRNAALIVLAGAISRYRAEPVGWCGDVERKLAREALAREHPNLIDFDGLLNEISAKAARLVKGCSKREGLPAVA